MKKTKYSEGGLTGRGNNQEGLDLRYDSPDVSVSRNTNQDSKSITVRNKDKSASDSESPQGKQYGLTTNGVSVNINKGNWGDKSASVSKGNWRASAGKDSQGKTNASVTFSKRF